MIGFKDCDLFSELPAQEVQALERIAATRQYSSGQVIFRQGDEGDGLYLIRDGQVQICVVLGPEDQRVLSRLEVGDFFGEMALIDNEPRSATALAEANTVTAFLPRAELMPILLKSPDLIVNLNRRFSRRMREFNQRYLQEVLQAERLSMVGRFARTIVHDFKNPLSAIGMAAEMVGSETTPLEKRQVAQRRIIAQVDRLSNMANELLEFTRGSSPRNILAAKDYAAFLRPLIDEIQHETALKSVHTVLESEPPHVQVRMDERRLSHVFYNLFNNAAGGALFWFSLPMVA